MASKTGQARRSKIDGCIVSLPSVVGSKQSVVRLICCSRCSLSTKAKIEKQAEDLHEQVMTHDQQMHKLTEACMEQVQQLQAELMQKVTAMDAQQREAVRQPLSPL